MGEKWVACDNVQTHFNLLSISAGIEHSIWFPHKNPYFQHKLSLISMVIINTYIYFRVCTKLIVYAQNSNMKLDTFWFRRRSTVVKGDLRDQCRYPIFHSQQIATYTRFLCPHISLYTCLGYSVIGIYGWPKRQMPTNNHQRYRPTIYISITISV